MRTVSHKQTMTDAVPANAHNGRVFDEGSIKIYRDSDVVMSHLTTSVEDVVHHFGKTRVFVKQEEQWRCGSWQVAPIL